MVMAEKRQHERFAISGKGTLKTESQPHKILKVELADVSYSGISVYANEGSGVGDIVLFDIATNVGIDISGKGKIKYARQTSRYGLACFKMGIEFVDTDRDKILGVITAYNSQRSKLKGKVLPSYNTPF